MSYTGGKRDKPKLRKAASVTANIKPRLTNNEREIYNVGKMLSGDSNTDNFLQGIHLTKAQATFLKIGDLKQEIGDNVRKINRVKANIKYIQDNNLDMDLNSYIREIETMAEKNNNKARKILDLQRTYSEQQNVLDLLGNIDVVKKVNNPDLSSLNISDMLGIPEIAKSEFMLRGSGLNVYSDLSALGEGVIGGYRRKRRAPAKKRKVVRRRAY